MMGSLRTGILLTILLVCVFDTEARRGGGSSYRASYRSSSYRSYYSSYSYRSYVAVRYTRAYTYWAPTYLYYYYHNLYFYHSAAYSRSTSLTSSTAGVCKNYEANSNGSYMGLFTCPLSFEPADFTSCCGEENSEYCCRWNDNTGNIVGVVFGAIIAATLVIVVIVILVRMCKVKKMKVSSSSNIRRRTYRSEISMTERSGRPSHFNTNYSNPHQFASYSGPPPPPPDQKAQSSYMFYSGSQQPTGYTYNDPAYAPPPPAYS
ncbi:uncharacterized protein LOC106165536 isoform X2 [Lingula anatina]|uniref:Uncharacterized protein LOC106165536 isoform X2 n=1 Tax=Lingula anatina TaxID=7574 RepID=A0A1S3ILV5_LINAN|nr:uncharacterized protein LOC106165536 isoform X2 [Lingula anatina]|eukprot:XP_013399202.1 uncharacterized protein LOC106165536 isoform X2 [Lingula anatina]